MKKVLFLIGAFTIVVIAGSCRTVEDSPDDELEKIPWNNPADWERQGIGLPF